MRIQRILISILVLAAVAGPAGASTLTYSSQSALETNNSDLTFTNISFSLYFGDTATSFNIGGVVFTDSAGGSLTIDNTGLLKDLTGNGIIDVSLPSNTLAFGTDVQNNLSYIPVVVNFTGDGSPYSTTTASGAQTYFGARDSSSLTALTLAPLYGGAQVQLSNFEIGTGATDPAPTPEAATLLLIGSGLMAMRFFKKRDKAREKLPPKESEMTPVSYSSKVSYASPQVAAGPAAA